MGSNVSQELVDQLVGVALKLAVDCGAQPELLFKNAVLARSKMGELLLQHQTTAPDVQLDLRSFVRDVVQESLGSVRQVKLPSKRVMVSISQSSRRTSITVPGNLFAGLVERVGTEKEVSKLLNKLAATMPEVEPKKRSKWFADEIKSMLDLPD